MNKLIRLIRLRYQQRRYREALQLAEVRLLHIANFQAGRQSKLYAFVYCRIGWIQYRLGNISEAIESLQNAVSSRPDLKKAYFGIFLSYSDLGAYDLALLNLNLWHCHGGRDSIYFANKSWLSIRSRKYSEAILTIHHGLENNPRSVKLNFCKAYILMRKPSKVDYAMRIFGRCARQNASDKSRSESCFAAKILFFFNIATNGRLDDFELISTVKSSGFPGKAVNELLDLAFACRHLSHRDIVDLIDDKISFDANFSFESVDSSFIINLWSSIVAKFLTDYDVKSSLNIIKSKMDLIAYKFYVHELLFFYYIYQLYNSSDDFLVKNSRDMFVSYRSANYIYTNISKYLAEK